MSRKERYISAPVAAVPDLDIAVPIEAGGTGGRSPLQAANSLEILSKYRLGQNNGAAKLDANGQVSRSNLGGSIVDGPTIKGPRQIYAEQTVEYIITNFDSLLPYTVSVSVGSITRDGALLSYVAPLTAGVLQLTVNGRVLTIPIQAATPLNPVILSPIDNALNQGFNLTFTASAMALPAGTANHESSNWEIATDPTFTTIVRSSYNDAVNKISWSVTALDRNTTYFVRTSQKDVTKGVSGWSEVTQFQTRNTNLPLYETALLRPYRDSDDLGGSVQFGDPHFPSNRVLSVSADGSRVAVCDPNVGVSGQTITGLLYVFRRENGSWVEELRLSTPADNGGASLWATSVDLDATGTRMAVGTGYNAFVYLRTGTTWTKEAKLANPSGTASLLFGYNVTIDSTGLRVAVTCGAGRRCYVFLRTGVTWAQEAYLNPPSAHTQYGSNTDWVTADFDENANRIILGIPYYDGAYAEGTLQPCLNSGYVHIYSRSGTNWTRDHGWLPPTQYDSLGPIDSTHNQRISNAQFGTCVVMSNDGNRVAIGFGSAGQDVESGPNVPLPVLVYRRDGVANWVVEAALLTPGSIAVGQGLEFDFAANGLGAIVSHYRNESGNFVGPSLAMFESISGTWQYTHSVTPSLLGALFSQVPVRLSGDGKYALVSTAGQGLKRVAVFT